MMVLASVTVLLCALMSLMTATEFSNLTIFQKMVTAYACGAFTPLAMLAIVVWAA